MAQLIKLDDYISRYEVSMYQYPTQYIRLKKDNWNKMRGRFEAGFMDVVDDTSGMEKEKEARHFWKYLFQKNKGEEESESADDGETTPTPRTLEELKQFYLDGLLPFQLKWASSTLQEKSFPQPSYQEDPMLKYYLQRFPDTFLLMYKAVAEIKKAEVEIDHLLIGPYGIDIITFISHLGGERIHPTSEHSWFIEEGNVQHKVINPLLSLRRTETFVKSVLTKYGLDFPYQKIVLAPDLIFGPGQEPYQTYFIGKDNYNEWFQEKRKMKSPLKHDQLKVAELLLKHCRTISVNRPEWEMKEKFMED